MPTNTKANNCNHDEGSPLLKALMEHHVTAKVVDTDQCRIRGGLAVETDYIITVKPAKDDMKHFELFTISKTYSAFRTLAQQLKKASDSCQKNHKSNNKTEELPPVAVKLCKYCELAFHLIDAQRTSYLGKVNYMYVKVLAKQRKQIIDDVLSATCNYFPTATDSHPLQHIIASIVETFLLTDHCLIVDDDDDDIKSINTINSSSRGSNSGEQRKHTNHTLADNLNPLAWIGGNHTKGNKKKLAVDTTTADGGGGGVGVGVIIPITRRNRKTGEQRTLEDIEMSNMGEEAGLLVDDDRPVTAMLPDYAKPVPTVRPGGTAIGLFMETNPWIFGVIFVAAAAMLKMAARSVISMDGDIFMLAIFASFCLGLHTPRPMVGGFDRAPTMKGTVKMTRTGDRSGRRLLRRSMIVLSPRHVTEPLATTTSTMMMQEDDTHGEDDDGPVMGSPMALFPAGAEIGSHFNCWSSPETSQFQVRGPNYLADKKKVPSGEYLFPCRGIDLFLTDACPQNVGRNAGVLGGRLRELPTFIINFRLPWGVLLLYCEIPKKFVPFLEASAAGDAEINKLLPSLKDMTPSERTAARWLMNDMAHKNATLKIVPVVVDGPWVVKSVVGGKPALIGSKLPINYVYQPAEGKDALYLEADLDIAASSAARGILSVARSYTQVLTMNLGFVIQGNEADELPEQMLMGARLHGIDPLTAPSLPPMDDDLNLLAGAPSDEESV